MVLDKRFEQRYIDNFAKGDNNGLVYSKKLIDNA